VSISSTLNVRIFHAKIHFGSFYYVHVTRKAAETKRAYEKFAHLTLMKLMEGVNFINILLKFYAPIFLRQKILNQKHSSGAKILYEKCTRKMLMKLTPNQTSGLKCKKTSFDGN